MKQIETSITINANRLRVWETLMAFDSYSQWNPFIRSISGSAHENSRIKVALLPQGNNRTITLKPVVLSNIPLTEFRWKGKLVVNGLFDGEHYFTLKDQPDGSTLLTHGEHFSGVLIPLLSGLLKSTEESFVQMNEALKKQAETA